LRRVCEKVEQESDDNMITWCLREKIIERKPAGGFKLCGVAKRDCSLHSVGTLENIKNSSLLNKLKTA
jgi:hypothetical protein